MGNLHFSGVFFSMSSLHFQKSEGNKKTELFGTPPDGCKTVGLPTWILSWILLGEDSVNSANNTSIVDN